LRKMARLTWALGRSIYSKEQVEEFLQFQAEVGINTDQVGRMPDTELIPDLRSKGVKNHTFAKN
jgi:hypothetical protein